MSTPQQPIYLPAKVGTMPNTLKPSSIWEWCNGRAKATLKRR